MVSVRRPLPQDAGVVAELVLLSDCGVLTALFGPEVRALITRLQADRANPYSAGHTLVVIDDGGAVVAAAVGARVSESGREKVHTAGILAAWFGPGVVARLPRLVRAGRALRDIAPADFYLSHIAVLPPQQGKGVGGALLRACERQAWSLGARRLLLDVDPGNAGARAFYQRMGYAQVRELTIRLGPDAAFPFHRMARDLGAGD